MEFRLEIAGLTVLLAVLAYLPLSFFTRALGRTRLLGGQEYAVFASQYVERFRDKWLAASSRGNPVAVLGTADIQSLADLGNSFTVVEEMRMVPFRLHDIVQVALLLLVPLLPLGLTIVSIDEAIDELVKLIL